LGVTDAGALLPLLDEPQSREAAAFCMSLFDRHDLRWEARVGELARESPTPYVTRLYLDWLDCTTTPSFVEAVVERAPPETAPFILMELFECASRPGMAAQWKRLLPVVMDRFDREAAKRDPLATPLLVSALAGASHAAVASDPAWAAVLVGSNQRMALISAQCRDALAFAMLMAFICELAESAPAEALGAVTALADDSVSTAQATLIAILLSPQSGFSWGADARAALVQHRPELKPLLEDIEATRAGTPAETLAARRDTIIRQAPKAPCP